MKIVLKKVHNGGSGKSTITAKELANKEGDNKGNKNKGKKDCDQSDGKSQKNKNFAVSQRGAKSSRKTDSVAGPEQESA